jgi:hypothetical protein
VGSSRSARGDAGFGDSAGDGSCEASETDAGGGGVGVQASTAATPPELSDDVLDRATPVRPRSGGVWHDRSAVSPQQIRAREVLMNRRTKLIAGGVVAVAVIGGGAAIAVAGGAGDDDKPLTGTTYDKAVGAALESTGGGTVTETEGGDDGAAYGVEVRLDDGTQVEVNLDENFNVIGQAADDDGANDQDGADDD